MSGIDTNQASLYAHLQGGWTVIGYILIVTTLMLYSWKVHSSAFQLYLV